MKIKKNVQKYSVLILFLFTFSVFFLSSPGETPYNYFTRLADSFINGKYWLDTSLPWLNELVPYNGKFFVPYPPMPAIVFMPFIFLFGNSFPQQYLAHLLGAGISVIFYLLAKKLYKKTTTAIWISLLAGLGNIIWFLSAVGSSWYLGQVTASFFLSLAIYLSLSKKSPWLTGACLGAAYLSRIHIIVSLPFFLYIVMQNNKSRKLFQFILGFMPFMFFNAIYNFIRFGVLWDIGYKLIPGVLNEPWYSKGLVHPSYIFSHLKIFFSGLPKFMREPPFIQPRWGGLAIWITTPAFIYALKAPFKKIIVKLSWLSVFLIGLIIFSHGGTGFTQFGYRYAVDFYPFLLLLTLKGIGKKKLKIHHWILLIISISVNLWGVLWINKFGWVGY
jgi:4-amino-4-deoxy-L-arabinose transferase-like glycosyltransferase